MRILFGIVGFSDLLERVNSLDFLLNASLRARDRNCARPYAFSRILGLLQSPRDTLPDASLLAATLELRF